MFSDSHAREQVVSRNTFPTAAGLASSAAGYACLVFALAKLLCGAIGDLLAHTVLPMRGHCC